MQLTELMGRAEAGDPAARYQLCALRVETYSNYLLAEMHWIAQYFQVVELAEAERPMVQNYYGKEVRACYVGSDGRPASRVVFKDDVEAALPLRQLTTPAMRYKVADLYRGSLVERAEQTLTLARDTARRMEAEAKALLDAMFGPFTFTGARANWSYVANSYLDTTHLPTTNDVLVTGASGYFDYPVLDEIIDYAARFSGMLAEDEGVTFQPTGRVRIAPGAARWFGTITAGVSTPGDYTPAAPLAAGGKRKAEAETQKLKSGPAAGAVNYKGIRWVFVADATLSDSPYAYPEFNLKPGRIYLRPDREFRRTGDHDPQLFASNEEERQMKTVFAAGMNSARRIYAARFNYSGSRILTDEKGVALTTADGQELGWVW